MRKHWQSFIALALAAFLFVIILSSLTHAQTCNPNQDTVTVCLDGKPIFIVPSSVEPHSFVKAPSGFIGFKDSYTREERAKEITDRIQEIAKDPSVDLESLQVNNLWHGGITTIDWGDKVIVTVTNKDARTAKVGIKNRKKLARIYLQRIKNAIEDYRNKHYFLKVSSWLLKNRVKNTLYLVIATIIFIVIFIIVRHLLDYLTNRYTNKFSTIGFLSSINFPEVTQQGTQKRQRFSPTNSDLHSLLNFIGLVIEIAFFSIVVILIIWLILIVFNDTYEAFFIKENFTTIDVNGLGDRIFDLLRTIGLLLLLGTLALLIHWLSTSRQGIVVLPFEDLTKEKKYNGNAISDLLVEELNRIREIHSLRSKSEDEEELILQNINFEPLTLGESLENHFIDIGTIGIGNSELRVGRIPIILRWLWPFGGIRKVISGSIQEHDSVTHLVGANIAELSLVGRLADGNKVSAWKAISLAIQMESLPDMVRELAYKLSMYLAPNIKAKSWESFKFFTEAIASYHRYKVTGCLNSLQEAKTNCDLAQKFDNKYQKLSDLFCMIGVAYFKEAKKQKKEEKYSNCKEDKEFSYSDVKYLFEQAIKINPKNAYPYNGLGNLYLEQFENEKALIAYKTSIKLDKDEKFAAYCYNGLGAFHYRQAEYSEAKKKI